MKKPEETFTLNIEQGDELIARLKEKSITQADYAMLINITRCYFWLILSLKEAKISMHRFKAMIFGSKKKKKSKTQSYLELKKRAFASLDSPH